MKRQLWCCALACTIAMVPAGMSAQGMGAMGSEKAMSKTTPEPPAKVYGALYKLVEGEIISAAEAMPADKYDFVPSGGNFTGVRSFGGQVGHLIGANYGFFAEFGMKVPMTEEQVAALKTKDQLVQALKDSFAFVEKGVASITAENAFVPIGKSEEFGTRAGAATFCLAHANDHYGQMVEYLRMNGIVPPASAKK